MLTAEDGQTHRSRKKAVKEKKRLDSQVSGSQVAELVQGYTGRLGPRRG